MEYAAAALLAGAFLAGCGNIRKLARSNPEAGVYLPAQNKREIAERAADTARGPKIITFRKQDGTELFLTPVAVDSASGEKMMSIAIDEVVISAANRRNLVERNGKINVDFIVSVPQTLQDRDWQLVLDPQLLKGEDTLTFDPLVYSGERFRASFAACSETAGSPPQADSICSEYPLCRVLIHSLCHAAMSEIGHHAETAVQRSGRRPAIRSVQCPPPEPPER